MKAIIKKSITLLAAVSLALPLASVPVAQAQETLSVVNLMPKADETASEKGLVKIHLVDKDGKVHKTLYYTSVNTADVTFNQIYDLLKGTYKIERQPQNVKSDTAKKHYVTDKGEFDGHTFEANFVLEAADSLPVEEAQRVTDQVLACGIRALWNFTPFRIRVPHNVVVQNTSIYANLAVMFNRLNSLTTR